MKKSYKYPTSFARNPTLEVNCHKPKAWPRPKNKASMKMLTFHIKITHNLYGRTITSSNQNSNLANKFSEFFMVLAGTRRQTKK
jgi:hypothetical protein